MSDHRSGLFLFFAALPEDFSGPICCHWFWSPTSRPEEKQIGCANSNQSAGFGRKVLNMLQALLT
jgi:hypothetical protein